jgi:hypothetical protein
LFLNPEAFPETPKQLQQLTLVKSQFWDIYRQLLHYKTQPTRKLKNEIEQAFEALCLLPVTYCELQTVLANFKKKKARMLHVLSQPECPLHNNLSEQAIREFVKRRKINGGTRSDDGKQCRDTFISLKKTCKKLNIGFWTYLLEREKGESTLPHLDSAIYQKHASSQLSSQS